MFVSRVSLHASQFFMCIQFYQHLMRKLRNYRGFIVSHNSEQLFYVAVNRHSDRLFYEFNKPSCLIGYLVF